MATTTAPKITEKTVDADIINWTKAPFSMDGKIPRNIRDAICKRFEVAINNLRDTAYFADLCLEDGWVFQKIDDVTFIVNPVKDQKIPVNADLKDETLDAGKLGDKMRDVRDAAWDAEKYSDLAKVAGLTLDASNGKITYKVV